MDKRFEYIYRYRYGNRIKRENNRLSFRAKIKHKKEKQGEKYEQHK